jgi:type 1 glutamine amidotransferase
MKKVLKIVGFAILGILILFVILIAGFIYKVKNGFPVSYETEKPSINFPDGQAAVLLFSKTTGFRHSEAIDASKKMFAEMARKNRWFLYETEAGGVFNPEQLAKFQVVIFNNSTGAVLNDAQQKALESYVENGGGLIGIHGSGDDSHHWDWYNQNLLGAKFSHHPIEHQLQETAVLLQPLADSTLWKDLSTQWSHTDEWYVFFDSPLKQGFTGIYSIDGEAIDPSGNILFVTSKNFGMGKNHPVAWYKQMGKGITFYTSMGHTGKTFKEKEMVQLLENAVKWQLD